MTGNALNLDDRLRQLLISALKTSYGSVSTTDGVETGNNYQSVALGDLQTIGFRADRNEFLDRIRFQDKKVLDLGSNLGEVSRAVRARGAYLVDGFERDPYFLEIAELINVFSDVARVSFYQRDITDPASYDEHYDIVIAFSVFRYIQPCLARIAKLTDVLLLETHLLHGNFEPDYLDPVVKHFPSYRILGESDWSRDDRDKTRAVVLFGKEETDIRAVLDTSQAVKAVAPETARSRAQTPRAYSKAMRGAIDDLRFDGKRLQIRGWCLDPKSVIDRVEISTEASGVLDTGPRGVLGIAPMTVRPDIRAAFEHVPHAGDSGFVFDCKCELANDGLIRFDLNGFNEEVPLGKVSAFYMPGMFTQIKQRPGAVAKRAMNASNPRNEALTSLKCTRELLEPVGRYRELSSFASVLDWGCRCGFLELFIADFLPQARITGIDTDDEAIAWCRQADLQGSFYSTGMLPPTDLPSDSFDLVIGHSQLTHLTRDAQDAWMREINRVMLSGGYAAVTVNGELMRAFLDDPDVLTDLQTDGISDRVANTAGRGRADVVTYQTRTYSLRNYARWFDVVSYVEGGVNNEQDLIVLRKA